MYGVEYVDFVLFDECMCFYIFYIDGIFKLLVGMGVCVGWIFGLKLVIDKIKFIFLYIGVWVLKVE